MNQVYPHVSRDELTNLSINHLMNEPCVVNYLGHVVSLVDSESYTFYNSLRRFVDSKEKEAPGVAGDSRRRERRQTEYWPLIKAVRIYIKADALSTGAVMVDLPGVQDSNAARAVVAENYLKQCTSMSYRALRHNSSC